MQRALALIDGLVKKGLIANNGWTDGLDAEKGANSALPLLVVAVFPLLAAGDCQKRRWYWGENHGVVASADQVALGECPVRLRSPGTNVEY